MKILRQCAVEEVGRCGLSIPVIPHMCITHLIGCWRRADLLLLQRGAGSPPHAARGFHPDGDADLHLLQVIKEISVCSILNPGYIRYW